MHCEDPGCLKACPSPGAIVQYANGIVDFHEENCIGCGYCVTGCPFDIPRISKKDNKAYKCTLCSDRVAVGLEPACIKACPTGRPRLRHQGGHEAARRRAHRGSEITRLRAGGSLRPGRRRRHACDVRAAPRRSAGAVQRFAREPADQSRWCACGRASAKPLALFAMAFATRRPASFITSASVPMKPMKATKRPRAAARSWRRRHDDTRNEASVRCRIR